MALRSTRPTVGTVRSVIVAAGTGLYDIVHVVISNTSANTIYLGGPDVTTANGLAVASTAAASVDLGPSDDLYAIAGSNSIVQVLAGRQN